MCYGRSTFTSRYHTCRPLALAARWFGTGLGRLRSRRDCSSVQFLRRTQEFLSLKVTTDPWPQIARNLEEKTLAQNKDLMCERSFIHSPVLRSKKKRHTSTAPRFVRLSNPVLYVLDSLVPSRMFQVRTPAPVRGSESDLRAWRPSQQRASSRSSSSSSQPTAGASRALRQKSAPALYI